MQLKQAAGNTWYLEDWQDIPIYKTSEHTCVLLDSGLRSQRDLIERTLERNGLTPVGILGSHVHGDHSANHRYFQQKYGIPVAFSAGEAGIAVSPLNLKAYYFYMLHPQQPSTDATESDLLVEADRIIMPSETKVEFCGVTFGIIHTPGHTLHRHTGRCLLSWRCHSYWQVQQRCQAAIFLQCAAIHRSHGETRLHQPSIVHRSPSWCL